MASSIDIGLTLKTLDHATPVISKVWNSINGLTNAPIRIGMGTAFAGNALKNFASAHQDSAMSLIKPFVTMEEAKTSLENSLMGSDGKVNKYLAAINTEATKLGDKLPGTTADFYQMATAMKKLGIGEQTIINGGLKSAAYLANVLKLPYDETAKGFGKMKEAAGIADKDLVIFADDLQRVGHMGVEFGQMEAAFSRASGGLKGLGIQGLESARALTPLFGMLIKNGMQGETTGTAISNAMATAMTYEIDNSRKMADIRAMLKNKYKISLDFTDDNGKFKGAENFVAQLEKVGTLKPNEQMLVLGALFGKGAGGDSLNTLIKNGGVTGLEEYKKKMAAQASLDQRVQNSLGTLGSLWEAFGGTMQNVFASITEAWSPELKSITKWLGTMASALVSFVYQTNTKMSRHSIY